MLVPSSNLRVTETKVTYFMLKGNRVEGQPKSRRGISPSGIHRCKEEADRQLAGQLAQQISSGGAAECHEGTSPTALHSALFSCCVHQSVQCVGLGIIAWGQCYCMSHVIVCPMLLYVFFQIFGPTYYAGLQPADAGLLRLGRQELDMLLIHFGVPKTSRDGKVHDAVICAETCRQEFLTFKRAAVRHRDACSERGPAGMLEEMFSASTGLQTLTRGKCQSFSKCPVVE